MAAADLWNPLELMGPGLEVSEVEELRGVVTWCNLDDPWGNRLGLYQDLARFAAESSAEADS